MVGITVYIGWAREVFVLTLLHSWSFIWIGHSRTASLADFVSEDPSYGNGIKWNLSTVLMLIEMQINDGKEDNIE